MQVLGIIAEYNPFHNGHEYHFKKSKEMTNADVTVAVMSGNFVQRGEPAQINKWIRTEMAVRNGIDLVLELPFVYACNNSDLFAKGSIALLDGLGCVDYLSFGSEVGEIEPLLQVADFIEPEPDVYSNALKEELKQGISYPSARQKVLEHFLGPESSSVIGTSNNILGIEYLKELKRLNSSIKPVTIKRYGASLNEANPDINIAGATAIRNMCIEGKVDEALEYIPQINKEILAGLESNNTGNAASQLVSMENLFEILTYSIISRNKEELSHIYSVTEGLENKLINVVQETTSVKNMISEIKSKRYTETRIKRVLIHTVANLTKDKVKTIIDQNQMYGRVLGFNAKGSWLLNTIKKKECARIPIVTNISKEAYSFETSRELFEFDIRSTDIYNLISNSSLYSNSDYRKIPFIM